MTIKNRAVVLTGGGARGAYQAGVLKYIAENVSEAQFDIIVGASSGAINAMGLASFGGDLKAGAPTIASLWSQLRMNQVFRTDIFSLLKIGLFWIYDFFLAGFTGKPLSHSLVDTRPLRELLQTVHRPDRIREAIEQGKFRSLAISATEVYTGSLVTFVQSKSFRLWQRARRKAVATEIHVDHVMASAAIPLLFPSVLVNNRRYVDGCIRSTSPLGPAIRLGANQILAIGVRRYYLQDAKNGADVVLSEPEPNPSAAQLGSLILNSLFSESLDADVEHLERLNFLAPEQNEKSFGMKKVEILVIRPSVDLGTLAKQYSDRVPLLIRFLLRGIGSERGSSSDILSYLLFVPDFLTALIDLGYRDAQAEAAKIHQFFRSH